MEVSSQMGRARRLLQTGRPIGLRIIELGIALVSISLQDAAGPGQMAMDVFFLPIWCECLDCAGR